jgi:hypothetical protein
VRTRTSSERSPFLLRTNSSGRLQMSGQGPKDPRALLTRHVIGPRSLLLFLLQGRITDIELCFDKQGGSYDSCTHFCRLLVIQIEIVCSRVGSSLCSRCRSKVPKAHRRFVGYAISRCFVAPKIVQHKFPDKDRERSAFFCYAVWTSHCAWD